MRMTFTGIGYTFTVANRINQKQLVDEFLYSIYPGVSPNRHILLFPSMQYGVVPKSPP